MLLRSNGVATATEEMSTNMTNVAAATEEMTATVQEIAQNSAQYKGRWLAQLAAQLQQIVGRFKV